MCKLMLYLSGSEVQNWLDKWGTNENVDSPKCHK